jgi:4-amino-4-deoxy-L-arabinose transferase-like glycosyltransferase
VSDVTPPRSPLASGGYPADGYPAGGYTADSSMSPAASDAPLTPATSDRPSSPVAVLDRPDVLDPWEIPAASDSAAHVPGWPGGTRRRGWVSRFFRGKESDKPWVRPALLVLLVATAVLYLWDLGASGWANSFYSAAVQAGTKSWKAFFFGSSDSSNFITVDKPPAFLWPMEISARIFGLNSWSLLVPQALEGVATVGLVYLSVRRWFSAQAALLGGAVVALTPVAAMMFRYNNPDAMLALLLTAATYAMMRGLEWAKTRWLVLAGALIGFGFITKMMQAFLVLPVFAVVYLLASPTGWWRRVWQVCLMGVSVVVAAGWWVAAVALTPAADRPYVGGSQDNSILNLIFGYNGFGRLTGNERGSVGGGGFGGAAGGSSMWGPTGWTRLFNSEFGTMMSWLLPGALVMGAVLLLLTIKNRRTDRERAALLLWGGSLVTIGLTFSLAQGIIHPYYAIALAPPLGALVGIATMGLWQRRDRWTARLGLAGGLAATVWWSYVLLGRTPDWFPSLRPFVAVVGILGVVAILALPLLRSVPKLAVAVVSALGLSAALAVPLFSTVATAATPHQGAIPSVTPTAAGGFGGPGGFAGGGIRRAFGGAFPGFRSGTGNGTNGGTNSPFGNGFPGGGFPGFRSGTGNGTNGGTNSPFGNGFRRNFGGAGGAGGTGGPGGFLSASSSNPALTRLLKSDASRYTWVAATVNSNSAAGYQLASDEPVMAIGGFNGTDPAPTLAQFERYVAEGKIHYFIGSSRGGFGGFGGAGGSGDASEITSWVESHFTAKTVGGVTVYDLTSGSSSANATG